MNKQKNNWLVYFIDNINPFGKMKVVYIADIHLKNMGLIDGKLLTSF